VEICNNNGHCRKFDAGTMCPSYRVTKDEVHLTRGRANTLRLALSGQLGADFASQAVRDALDLCVSCKGCRRECPTGVDMAKMKIEFNHHWQRAHGLSVRERMIARLPHWAPRGGNALAVQSARHHSGGEGPGRKFLGTAAHTARWRRDTFLGNGSAASDRQREHGPADVVLFVDTFTNYFEPENARAAVAVLRAGNFRVHVARAAADDAQPNRPLCCGRTFLAAGMVDEAKHEARRVVAALAPHAARGAAIVGLEPSCLLTLRDEFLVMGMGDAAQRLSESTFLIEEFLARELRAGRLDLPLAPLPESRALLHGHCHQKAFDALSPALAVLKLVPGLDVQLIESSCCGMAGSFGFEAAHYDVSMRMAELSLLPVRPGAAADTLIVADGTSCRHQIDDGMRGADPPAGSMSCGCWNGRSPRRQPRTGFALTKRGRYRGRGVRALGVREP
jgi:Fe-S oxidoreductase